MEHDRPRSRLFEPAMYRISIVGSLDTDLSDYYGSMTIEQTHDLTSVDDDPEGSFGRPVRAHWCPQFAA